MSRHPSLDIVESYGTELSGKKIVLCVAGSVAAYKSIAVSYTHLTLPTKRIV